VQGAHPRLFRRARRSEGTGISKDAPIAPINTVAIVGAGTMGGGIAMACANAGLNVIISDTGQQQLDSGLARIRSNYDTSMKRGRFTAEGVQERLGRIERKWAWKASAVPISSSRPYSRTWR
jgi:NADPH-dependent 2,4-dienoyl-CoA reductase/sulfur reductase-like enzyme